MGELLNKVVTDPRDPLMLDIYNLRCGDTSSAPISENNEIPGRMLRSLVVVGASLPLRRENEEN